jgi:hypothetical protein
MMPRTFNFVLFLALLESHNLVKCDLLERKESNEVAGVGTERFKTLRNDSPVQQVMPS